MLASKRIRGTKLGLGVGLALALAFTEAEARSQEPVPGSSAPTIAAREAAARGWNARYRAARAEFDAGNVREAYVLFLRLEAEATSESDHRLASEMASVSRVQLERIYGPRFVLDPHGATLRTSDELSVLYATAFLYGLGTGAWFILETRPTSVPAAIAPFAGLTIASVGAVSIVDRYRPFEAGVPQAIAAGTYLGLGQAAWVVGYQQARAARVEKATGYDSAWRAPTIATVLWLGATGGAALGTAVGVARKPSPGRVSFTMSTALWSGAIGSFAAAAAVPEKRRLETTLVIGGGAYNAGLLTGLITGPLVSPSLTRVRLVDLGGVAGGLLGAATYLITDSDDQRATFGATALGATAGLALSWWLTSSMSSSETAKSGFPQLEYALVPTPGGGLEVRAGTTM